MTVRRLSAIVILAALIVACGTKHTPEYAGVDLAALQAHAAEFEKDDDAVDDPSSAADGRAIEYVRKYFQSLGLETIVQSVPLVRLIPTETKAQLRRVTGTQPVPTLGTSADILLLSGQQEEHALVDADLVFAGYGIVSPEYDRDDYKQVNVEGKIVVVLDGSPMTGEHDELGDLGETYYGTASYKFTEAARHGAAATIVVKMSGPAAWSALRADVSGAFYDVDAAAKPQNADPTIRIGGWVSQAAAERLIKSFDETLDLAAMVLRAHELGFQPIPLPDLRATLEVTSTLARFNSHDVIAVLPGQTPEHVMVAGRWNRIDPAAWRHVGHSASILSPSTGVLDERDETSRIGAAAIDDDGSGAVVVMETARRMAARQPRPTRGVVFMVSTALKPGILGIQYYVNHPPPSAPIDQMIAAIFLDRGDLAGSSSRIGKIGMADSALSQIAREAAIEQGRLLGADESPERRFYYRVSRAAFAQAGVRAIYLTTRPEAGAAGESSPPVQRDAVLGVAPAAAPPANPSRDPSLLVMITERVTEATNLPPRRAPSRPSKQSK